MIDTGWWTKVLLDEEGHVIDTDSLDESDLPKHSHKLSDIDNIEGVVKNLLESFFVDHDDSTVKFTFNRDQANDGKHATVEASVKIDEDTIKMNEFGELYVDIEGLSTGESSSHESLDLGSFKLDLINEITSSLPHFTEGANGALSIEKVENTYIFGVKVDDYTIHINPETDELEVDTDVLASIIGSGEGGFSEKTECGTHTHTSSQITDFQEAVLELIKNNVTFEIDNIKDLIDDVTIKVNQDGKIYSVAGSSVKPHTHKLEDIEDWNDDWTTKAVLQSLSFYLEYLQVDSLDSSVVDFENMTIGQAIYALDQQFARYNQTIRNLKIDIAELKSLTGTSPTRVIAQAELTGSNTRAYYMRLSTAVDVYLHSTVKIEIPGFNTNTGSIKLVYDGVDQEEVTIDDLLLRGTSGIYSVSEVYGDRENEDTNFTIKAALPEVNYEGAHTISLKYIARDGNVYQTRSWTLYTTPFKNCPMAIINNLQTHMKYNTSGELTPFLDVVDGHPRGNIEFKPDLSTRQFIPLNLDKNTKSFVFGADAYGVTLGEPLRAQFNLCWLFESQHIDYVSPYVAELSEDHRFEFANLLDEHYFTILNDKIYGLKPFILRGREYFAVTIYDGRFIINDFRPDTMAFVEGSDYILRSDFTDINGNIILSAIGLDSNFGESAVEGEVLEASKVILNNSMGMKVTTVGQDSILTAITKKAEKHYTTLYFASSQSGKISTKDIRNIWLQ